MNTAADLPSSYSLIRLMGAVSVICGLLIVGTHLGTLEPIRRNQETILRETVAQLLPGVSRQVTYGADAGGALRILSGSEASGPRLFAGYDANGKLLGIVLEASERGYADIIRAMYAYSPEKEAIVDFRVLEMKETPGLGDKINTDPGFLENFRALAASLNRAGTALEHPIAAVKHGTKKNPWEVDAISGATISSRAVGRMLNRGAQEMIPLIHRNLDRIRSGQ